MLQAQAVPILVYHRFDPAVPGPTTVRTAIFESQLAWLEAFKDYAFDHRVFGVLQISEQIRAADDFGSDGWMLWNPHNRYERLGVGAHEQVKNAVSTPH
jgi:hypothetical protein